MEADLPFDMKLTPVLPLCPEQLGGLPTPRIPSQIVGGSGEDVLDGNAKVIMKDGTDVTENFIRGAEEVCALAEELDIRQAFLAEYSPSCGVNGLKETDGNVRHGCGVTVAALRRIGVTCVGVTGKKV
jgi:uncharacterized protein YbbK (DUF523 family)